MPVAKWLVGTMEIKCLPITLPWEEAKTFISPHQ